MLQRTSAGYYTVPNRHVVRRLAVAVVLISSLLVGCDAATAPERNEVSGLEEVREPMHRATVSDALVLLHEYRDDYLDGSGQNNDGAPVGDPVFVEGAIDRAVELDGVGDLVRVSSSPSLEPANVTVEICFAPETNLGTGDVFVPLIVKLDPNDNFSGIADGYDLTYQDQTSRGGELQLHFGIADGSTRVQAKSTTTLSGGTFHHVVGTYDQSEMRLYLNGELAASRGHTASITYRGGPVSIGGGIQNLIQVPSGDLSYLDGQVEEVAIYDRALTPEEVSERSVRCGASTPPPPPPEQPALLRHTYLDDALDESGNGNHGTIEGGASFTNGPIDRAIVLDGVDDVVSVPYSSSLQPAQVTVEMCLQPSATLGAGDTFVPLLVKLDPRDQFGGIVDGYDLTYQHKNGVAGLNFGIGDENTRTRVQVHVETDLEAGLYHHVVGTYDGSMIRLFRNGTQIGAVAHSNPIDYRGGPVLIGGNVRNLILLPSGEASFFAGSVEEAVIYGTALSPTDIAERSQACIGVPSPEELLGSIEAEINDLRFTGILNKGQANALSRKVESATRFLNKDEPHGAINVVQALLNQVNSFIDEGVLTPAEAESILAAAQSVIDQLSAHEG